MQETKLDNTFKFRCTFIELMDYLEKISIDYADLNIFTNFIYMDPKNEYNYKISKVINNKETYIFQFLGENKEHYNIPNAIFIPENLYDFELDLNLKKFKKFNEYKIEEIINIINIINNDDNKKNKSFIRKIFGC